MREECGDRARQASRLRDAAIAGAAGATRPVLLIDGGSGAGKTMLSQAVGAVWPEAAVLHVDDWTPGWDGLEAASAILVDEVLGAPSAYRSWDWRVGGPGSVSAVPRHAPLIIEGCGALTRRSRELASHAIWLEVDEATRRRRALARDGGVFAPHWDRWAAQERAHWRRERPDLLADEILGLEGA